MAPPDPCACPPFPVPWWMVAVAVAAGAAVGYVVKDQQSKKPKAGASS